MPKGTCLGIKGNQESAMSKDVALSFVAQAAKGV